MSRMVLPLRSWAQALRPVASAVRPRPMQLVLSPCLASVAPTAARTPFVLSRSLASFARSATTAKPTSPSVSPLHTRLRSLALQWTARASCRASSTSTNAAGAVAPISHPIIGKWFLFSSSLVFAIVVVGGITRLTESGLSITEWNLIRGMAWPSTKEAWEEEFSKYQQSPEYKLLNHNITMDEFKNIFYWEWFHRNLGRTIGMVFLLPALFFTFTRPSAARVAKALGSSTANPIVASRWMSSGVTKAAWACCVLVGFQGALGWYMVKSGLENDIMELNHATPRVSQYRLAAHLGSAFVIYVISLWNGFEVLRTWSNVVKNNGVNADRVAMSKVSAEVLAKCRSLAKGSHWVAGLVFLTALSGAFVAGLDAGLVYNTWPMMGDRFVPPAPELFRSIHKTSINGNAVMDPIDPTEKITLTSLFENQRWKNIFENPVTVQTDHRLLAYTTFAGIAALWLKARRLPLPRPVHIAAHGVLGVALAQVTLGITTLLYFVPIELAAAHQGGSLALLTSAMWLMHKIKHAVPK